MKRLSVFLMLLMAVQFSSARAAFGIENGIVETKYTIIHFDTTVQLNKFIFRIGGQKFDFISNPGLASNRIDRLIDRVQAIMDMHVPGFKVDIFVKSGALDRPETAYFDIRTRAIYVSCDTVTDGIFAHEAAHAIISSYFETPPTSKIQEILAQYVDKELWSDY